MAAVQPNPFELYLQPGDNIEAEIEGIGVLRNHVVPWSAPTTPAVLDRPVLLDGLIRISP